MNLAYELAKLGGRVGLLDLDIYGPSLPVLVKPDDPVVRQSPLGKGMVYPIGHKGVKLLSLGFVSSKVRDPIFERRVKRTEILTFAIERSSWQWTGWWCSSPSRTNGRQSRNATVSSLLCMFGCC